VARLAGLYGPGRSVILRKFLEGSAVIEESGQRILNQIHVEDAASAVLHLAHHHLAGLFNVTDDRPLSQLACYQGLARHFDRPLPPAGEKNTSRKRAWTNKKVLNAKIRETGWIPTYPGYFDALDSLLPDS
jgi:nucleoside-diphosphate-sugar epimerase